MTPTSQTIAQTPTASACHHNAVEETTHMTWIIIALLFLVVAILLVISSIALGTLLYLTRKSLKSVSASKLRVHQG